MIREFMSYYVSLVGDCEFNEKIKVFCLRLCLFFAKIAKKLIMSFMDPSFALSHEKIINI